MADPNVMSLRYQSLLQEHYLIKRECDQVKQTLGQTQNERDKLQNWQDNYATLFQQKCDEYDRQLYKKNDVIRELRQEARRLKEDLRLALSDREHLRNQNATLERELDREQVLYRSIRVEARVQRELDELRAQVDLLARTQAEGAVMSRVRSRHTSGEVQASLERLRKLMGDVQREKQELASDLHTTKEENTRLMQTVDLLFSDQGALAEELRELRVTLAEAQADRTRYQEQKEALEIRYNTICRDLKASETQLQQMKTKFRILNMPDNEAMDVFTSGLGTLPTSPGGTVQSGVSTPRKRFKAERLAQKQCSACLQFLSGDEKLDDSAAKCHYHPWPPLEYHSWKALHVGEPPCCDASGHADYKYYLCCSKFATRRPQGCQEGRHVIR